MAKRPRYAFMIIDDIFVASASSITAAAEPPHCHTMPRRRRYADADYCHVA